VTPDRVDRYLARIGYDGSRDPTLETLRTLHLAHLYSVPFENLDIHWGQRIVLDEDVLFRKIVEARRGGFCYELNGLFAVLLSALGFDVTMLSARVVNSEDVPGPEFEHMALLVAVEGAHWLADVGFGESSRWPLDLAARREQASEVNLDHVYRIGESNGVMTMSHRSSGGEWRRGYLFTLVARELADYEPMCVVQQTSPDSHFVRHTVCSLATSDGRKSLSADRFIVTRSGGRTEREVSPTDWNRVLLQEFGIEAPAGHPRP